MVQRNHSWERQSVGFKLQFCCQTPAEMLEERMANTSSRQSQTTSSNYQIRYFWHDCHTVLSWYIVAYATICSKYTVLAWLLYIVVYCCHTVSLLQNIPCMSLYPFNLNEVDMTGMERRKTSIDREQNTMIVSYCFECCHSWYVRTHPYESRLQVQVRFRGLRWPWKPAALKSEIQLPFLCLHFRWDFGSHFSSHLAKDTGTTNQRFQWCYWTPCHYKESSFLNRGHGAWSSILRHFEGISRTGNKTKQLLYF